LNKILLKIHTVLPLKIQIFWKRVENSEIGSRIAKGAFWSLTGAVISQGLMLLASIVVARILGRTEYGELGMIRSTVNMFAVFAGFGLGMTATKYVAELKIKDKIKTGKIIGLTTLFAGGTGGIIAIAILIAAPFLAEKTINAPQLVNEIRLGAVILFFSAINGAQTGILAGFEAFKTIAKVNLLAGVLAFPIQIGFTLFLGLPGSVIGFGLNFLIMWILNFYAVRKESQKFDITIQIKNAWNEWHVLYKFSLPALLSGILVSPVMWACNAMLVNKPNGYNEMALFDAANQWRNIILFIPAVLSQIVLPLLSGSRNNQEHFNRILKLNVGINFFISLILAIVISLFAGIFMKAYGQNFAAGKTVLIILTFTAVLISVNNVIGQAIAGIGQMWYGFLLNFIWGVTLLTSAYLFLNLGYGAKGLAYGILISYSVHTLLVTIFTSKYLSKITVNQ
jgi:O-antigen/teichoic acid export membrane protein